MSSRTSTRKSTRGEFIETDTGNKISRRSRIEGTPHIILGGRVVVHADACLRGDLVKLPSPEEAAQNAKGDSKGDPKANQNARTSISVGRYTIIGQGATLHPPSRVFRARAQPAPDGEATATAPTQAQGELSYYPMKLSEHIYISPHAFVSAASIGSHVFIGAGAVVGNGCIIRDGSKILAGSILVPGMVVPSGVVVGGRPARVIGEVGEGWGMGVVGGLVGMGRGVGDGEGVEGSWGEGGELREAVRGVR